MPANGTNSQPQQKPDDRPGLHGPVILAFFILVAAGLTGCATPQYRTLQQDNVDLPRQASVADVPFYPQEAYYCGPASLAMMLSWSGTPVTQEQVAEQVYTPGRSGTLPTDLLSGARRHGALAVEVDSLRDLLTEIAAGRPVLVFQNLGLNWWPQWHFAVAFEYDLDSDNLVLHSGTQERRVTDLRAFERTWQRADYWAITVTPPHELPATADTVAMLRGAAGLERAGELEAAITAYTAIGERWPDNIAARMGLGNSQFARQRFADAAASYREALTIDADYAPAWNNLAYALAGKGERAAAIEAAERAVAISPDNDNFRETLEEMRSGNAGTT